MSNTWTITQGKDGFPRLVREAQHAPQFITKHGKAVAVVVPMQQYRLGGRKTVASLFHARKYRGLNLEVKRDKTPARKVVL